MFVNVKRQNFTESRELYLEILVLERTLGKSNAVENG